MFDIMSLLSDLDWKGLALPFAYLLVLGGALASFSTIYRKRKAAQSANLAPWFGPHLQRNIYLTLVHQDGDDSQPKVPDSVLRAALLRRAVEDYTRLIKIKSSKAACSALLQRGSVGDDLWQRFQRADKELEDELRDVVMEANTLAPNWGSTIFQTAHEIVANTKLRDKLTAIQRSVISEKEWWAKRRDTVSTEFMKELDNSEEKSPTKAAASEDDAVLVDTPSKAGKDKKKAKK